MCTNVSLYNTYLKGVRIGAGSGFPGIWPPACGSRASKIWWGYRVQVFDFRAVLLGSLRSSLELSVWPFAFLLFCLIFYSLYLLAINHNMKRLWDTVHMLQPMIYFIALTLPVVKWSKSRWTLTFPFEPQLSLATSILMNWWQQNFPIYSKRH